MRYKKQNSGFTLIELIVVVAVIGLILTVVLGSQNKYSDRLNLKNQAYNLVVKIRQAQVNSLGVVSNTTSPQNFNISYGVYVDADSSKNKIIIYFIDNNSNGVYDGGAELLESLTISGGVTINNVCSSNCGGGVSGVSVTFKRPNPSATIKFINNGGNEIPSRTPPGTITLRSVSGSNNMTITIDSTGQISIQ